MRTTHFNFETSVSIPLDVAIRVRGSHTPARINADPDDCHDVEHDEEREVLGVTCGDEELPRDLVKTLTPYLLDAVYDAEVTDSTGEP